MHVTEPSILHALEVRFNHDIIYTSTGPILIAVNPFKAVSLYTEEVLRRYERHGIDKSHGASPAPLPPHAYAVADNAYRFMVDPPDGETVDQSILVSGESGAGKTVTTKVKYFASLHLRATCDILEIRSALWL